MDLFIVGKKFLTAENHRVFSVYYFEMLNQKDIPFFKVAIIQLLWA